VIAHCNSSVPHNGQGVETKLVDSCDTIYLSIDSSLFNATTLFGGCFGIQHSSPSIGRIQIAFLEASSLLEMKRLGQLCHMVKFKLRFPVTESFEGATLTFGWTLIKTP
jgi:hypothetical protein